MKKLIYKSIGILSALALSASMTAAAFAATPPSVSPLAMGISKGTVRVNGKDYAATFSLGGTASSGGYSSFTTEARCIRAHKTVSVTFNTKEGGYQTRTGGAKTIYGSDYKGVTGATTSYHVTYSGTDTPISIYSISATLTATVKNENGTTPSFNFSAGA